VPLTTITASATILPSSFERPETRTAKRLPASMWYAPILIHMPPSLRWFTSVHLIPDGVLTPKRVAALLPLAAGQRA
jgi:hypothetical protein